MAEQNTTSLSQKLLLPFVAFALGALAATTLNHSDKPSVSATGAEPLLEYNGQTLHAEQLNGALQTQLHETDQEHYQKRLDILKRQALALYFADKAVQDGTDERTAAQQLLQAEPPTEAEMREFYENNRIQRPLEEVKEQIRSFITQQRIQSQRNALLSQIEEEKQVNYLITPPGSPALDIATDGYPTKGDPDAPVHIVEFADYQCPHCKNAAEQLKPVLDQFEGKVKLTFMDFPINRSGISRQVAEGAVCAHQQGKFWEYHDLAFAQQASLNSGSPSALAETLELDQEAFAACYADPETAEKVRNSETQAIKLGVRATPTLFINGREFTGENLGNALVRAIEAEL